MITKKIILTSNDFENKHIIAKKHDDTIVEFFPLSKERKNLVTRKIRVVSPTDQARSIPIWGNVILIRNLLDIPIQWFHQMTVFLDSKSISQIAQVNHQLRTIINVLPGRRLETKRHLLATERYNLHKNLLLWFEIRLPALSLFLHYLFLDFKIFENFRGYAPIVLLINLLIQSFAIFILYHIYRNRHTHRLEKNVPWENRSLWSIQWKYLSGIYKLVFKSYMKQGNTYWILFSLPYLLVYSFLCYFILFYVYIPIVENRRVELFFITFWIILFIFGITDYKINQGRAFAPTVYSTTWGTGLSVLTGTILAFWIKDTDTSDRTAGDLTRNVLEFLVYFFGVFIAIWSALIFRETFLSNIGPLFPTYRKFTFLPKSLLKVGGILCCICFFVFLFSSYLMHPNFLTTIAFNVIPGIFSTINFDPDPTATFFIPPDPIKGLSLSKFLDAPSFAVSSSQTPSGFEVGDGCLPYNLNFTDDDSLYKGKVILWSNSFPCSSGKNASLSGLIRKLQDLGAAGLLLPAIGTIETMQLGNQSVCEILAILEDRDPVPEKCFNTTKSFISVLLINPNDVYTLQDYNAKICVTIIPPKDQLVRRISKWFSLGPFCFIQVVTTIYLLSHRLQFEDARSFVPL